MRIIDANLLIYAFNDASPSHQTAGAWLKKVYEEDDLVGLPRLVLLAFIRIVTNPRIIRSPATTEDALSVVETLLQHPKTLVVEPGPNHWTVFRRVVLSSRIAGPSITDAYLASLAVEHGYVLCSADQGFRRFLDLKLENPLLQGSA